MRKCANADLNLQKRLGSRSDPNGIQERLFRQFKNLSMRY